MAYETLENSNDGGKPISLYRFLWDQTEWLYTGADRNITATVDVGSRDFVAVAISDTGLVQGGSQNNDLMIKVDPTIPLVDLFHSTPPSQEIELTVYRKHHGDSESFIAWKGYVSNVKRSEDGAYVTIIGRTFLSSFERDGLRLAWVRGCPHLLYDDECRVDRSLFAHSATITALDGNSITVDDDGGLDPDWVVGGFVEWEANEDGTKDYRSIQSQGSTTNMVLLGTTYRLEVGMAVTLYPGCDLVSDTCLNKFNNLANFGGFEQMSGENVFDGEKPIM